MKVFRFMSDKEFNLYNEGALLANNTKHEGKTNSVGFCFLNLDDFKPEDAFHFLTGVVSIDKCCIFEVDKKYLTESYGIYAKPIPDNLSLEDSITYLIEHFEDSFQAKEYCCTSYSKDNFKLIAYVKPDWFNENDWDWVNVDE